MRKTLIALAMGAAAIAATPASAATTVNFTGSNFTDVFNSALPGPADPVQGSFTYDFDAGTNAFTLSAVSVDVGAVHYDLGNTLASLVGGTALSIGGTPNGAATLGFPNDFVLNMLFNPATGQIGSAIQLQYSTPNFHLYQANNLDISTAPVPEPATWAMMLLGFLGMGTVLRRSSRKPVLAQVA